ncbi:CHAD domain-containing protein [Virgisporangium aliadipatigenens]|uniref:CHAD domain-containing protein n=1 Tax=Virgisporangium aliadipatigenens TaxID=741659 RepID=A0A8J4DQW3_9ACTN|nr:CYTH and CHAD domain-containing protein [Virgisporangium aliadipatigenens]GIJ45732.1 CHAD domain-containing protein [Virgisporangium aliadipatigenens]
MLEVERKFGVGPGFVLPDLTGHVPEGGTLLPLPAQTLRATYYDTADLRLTRAGVSLRQRKGEPGKPPWTMKLPTDVVGARAEFSRGRLDELLPVLTAYHRGWTVVPVVSIRTLRRVFEVRDAAGELLVEVCDDTVSVLSGREVVDTFREIEAERGSCDDALFDAIGRTLTEAGAVEDAFVPKHVRALGERIPAPDAPAGETAGDAVTAAFRAHVARIVGADPYLRLGTPQPNGDSPVHQLRVGCRRLRSDLRTFRPLLDPEWARALADECRWLAGSLGAARDSEVLRVRLRRTAAADPVAPLDPDAVERIDAALAARLSEALGDPAEAVDSPRYLALLEQLNVAATAPPLLRKAKRPAVDVLPKLVAKPWRRLADGREGEVAPAELDPLGPDDEWHEVRIRGKKARYAAQSVVPAIGEPARALIAGLKKVQKLLGEHQDAAMAADAWRAVADAVPADHGVALTAGRLIERERAAVRAARAAFPEAWAIATEPERIAWLST